jgi:nucleoside 2-deoxyribosyltransferase
MPKASFSRRIAEALVPAHLSNTTHSVGVGDCFNAIYAALQGRMDDRTALGYASLAAAEYAATYDDALFDRRCRAVLGIPPNEASAMTGVSIPWEKRQQISVYVAAPDFQGTNRKDIEDVASCLRYHNFRPRLPVRENGEVPVGAPARRKRRAFEDDVRLLKDCQALIAVLPFDDPGTLVEIGIAHQMGIPVLVYDPCGRVSNLMVSQLAEVMATDLDVLLNEFFRVMSSGALK